MPALDAGIFFVAMADVEHGHDEMTRMLIRNSIRQEIGNRRHHAHLLVDLPLRPVIGNGDRRVDFDNALIGVLDIADLGALTPGQTCPPLRAPAWSLR